MGDLGSLGVCELAFGDNPDRLCGWCGKPLEGRRRRWCSTPCSWGWAENHVWGNARGAARKRDGDACVICQVRHGYNMTDRSWTTLEVNHILPRKGGGYENGCHHHLDGLETLCHEHHLDVTKVQRTAGWDKSARELHLLHGRLVLPGVQSLIP